MAHWQLMTAPAKPDSPSTGTYADGDLRFRLRCLVDMIVKAEAGAREAQQRFDADVAGATRNGQEAIAAEFIRDLAERRAREGRPCRARCSGSRSRRPSWPR